MSDIATGEHRGAEVRRSGGTRNVTFLRDWNLARQFAISSGKVFLRNSDAQEMNSQSIYRLKRSLRSPPPEILYFTYASTLYHPGAAPRGENVVKISIRNLNIPTQQGLQEWGKSFESSKTLAVGGYAVGKLDLGS